MRKEKVSFSEELFLAYTASKNPFPQEQEIVLEYVKRCLMFQANNGISFIYMKDLKENVYNSLYDSEEKVRSSAFVNAFDHAVSVLVRAEGVKKCDGTSSTSYLTWEKL